MRRLAPETKAAHDIHNAVYCRAMAETQGNKEAHAIAIMRKAANEFVDNVVGLQTVKTLLQQQKNEEARGAAMKIACQRTREQALILIERSHPITS